MAGGDRSSFPGQGSAKLFSPPKLSKPLLILAFSFCSRLHPAISVWESIFSSLLNVRSCAPADYPDLASLRGQCEAFLRANASDYNVAAEKANAIIAHLGSIAPSAFFSPPF